MVQKFKFLGSLSKLHDRCRFRFIMVMGTVFRHAGAGFCVVIVGSMD
jgi:hypothetical protein